ncbi:adenosylcobinamide-phosphate synthase CbiB [Desulforamulus aeronauticus]|uniref:Cobalamin biosynthesis protein CobD n=1 Tax=Desulforamulus aeronauticus DSM 10349 TaxID=1121421 RepID=A0A1M6SE95_9FIRM|nr:adenosylcobinamide-phosphate synthase CbiB [Desulforamulus aeronauticus]SHK43030.1 adenosylcobinamide-phosphate synthase [Desulforamulus aeronauticus DSM 10349]
MSVLVVAALLLDLMVGDPRWLPHPVVVIGGFIQKGEKLVRRFVSPPMGKGLRLGGIALVAVICFSTYFCTWGFIWLAAKVHVYLGWAVHLWLLSTTLAVKSLHQHARAVAVPLALGDLSAARRAVAMIVGRDTKCLQERGITRATVETVAENTVDGIISPLFYAFIGGAPLAMTYKAINTLDSMIGHRNEKYLYFGWAAARLDDLANYLPARLAGFCYVLAAIGTPGGMQGTRQTIQQNAPKHPSPNSGIPEAAVAGALGIKLGGTNYYQGQVSHRAPMGQEKYPLEYRHIEQALALTRKVTALALVLGVVVGWAVGPL